MPPPLPGDLPEPVRTLIDRALLKDPADRFPDGAAFREAVDDVRAGRSLPPVPKAGDTRPFVAAGERPRPLPRRLLAPVAALVVGVGLGAAALQVWGSAPTVPVAQAQAGVESPEPVVVRTGDLVGRPVDEVEAGLTRRGLGVERTPQETAEMAAGLVVAVSPVGALPPGTVVTLTYAVPPPPSPTPAPVPAPAPAPVPTLAATPVEEAGGTAPGSGNGGRPAGNGNGNGGGNGGGNGRGGGKG